MSSMLRLWSTIAALLPVVFTLLASPRPEPTTRYYLRHSIIYLGDDVPKVATDLITFTTRCIRGVDSQVYQGTILRRGTLVTVGDIQTRSDLATVSFSSENHIYTMLVQNDSKKHFEQAFNLIFTRQPPKEYYKSPKTKAQLIKYYGFPISICKQDDFEEWFYIPEFAGPAGGFDGFLMKLRGNKIIDVYGYI